ncbi:MAG: FAD binding domain-containing protein [Paludibaculum sp.]
MNCSTIRSCALPCPLSRRQATASPARRSAIWARSAATSASGPAAGISAPASACCPSTKGTDLVTEGDNRYHAIFGDGAAKFVSASSFGPALVALGAKVKLASAAGTREVDAAKFFVAPANNDAREIALLPNEILTEIHVPVKAGEKNAAYEVRQKDAMDWPLAAAAVTLTMKGSTVASANIVLGHVGPTPYWAEKASSMLAGKTITEETAEAAGKAAVEGAKPLSHNTYKVQLASVAVKRALLAAAGVKS